MKINKFLYKLKVLHYDRIDVSKGINVNKTSQLKELIFATIGIFKIKGLNFN